MKHLTQEEKWQIKALIDSGKSGRAIARQLDRSHSTISRQIRLGLLPSGKYSPLRGKHLYMRSRKSSGKNRRKLTGKLWKVVRKLLILRLSPEQAAGRIELVFAIKVSHTAIYDRIWREKTPTILHCLRHRRKKYRRRGLPKRRLIPNRTDISQRPDIVEEKLRIGAIDLATLKLRHRLEGDTIVGARQQGAIVSLVDRKSKFTLLKQVNRKDSTSVRDAIIAKLKPHKKHVLTITYDNGCEFVKHDDVNAEIGCDSYFCTPYHSW